jgi:hypothetical protein
MSQLEGTAKPLLEPLITGRTATLTVDEQRLVATWATKTALMAALGQLDSVDSVPPAVFHALREQGAPSTTTSIVVGAYHGKHTAQVRTKRLRIHDNRGVSPALGSTMFFGALLFVVLITWDFPDGLIASTPALLPLWPPTPNLSPLSQRPFSDEDIDLLWNSLAPNEGYED